MFRMVLTKGRGLIDCLMPYSNITCLLVNIFSLPHKILTNTINNTITIQMKDDIVKKSWSIYQSVFPYKLKNIDFIFAALQLTQYCR